MFYSLSMHAHNCAFTHSKLNIPTHSQAADAANDQDDLGTIVESRSCQTDPAEAIGENSRTHLGDKCARRLSYMKILTLKISNTIH